MNTLKALGTLCFAASLPALVASCTTAEKPAAVEYHATMQAEIHEPLTHQIIKSDDSGDKVESEILNNRAGW